MQSLYLCFTIILLTIIFQAPIRKCQNVTCNANDLKALMSFSDCVESGLEEYWNVSTSSSCCSWQGVTCNNSTNSGKRVVSLELVSKRLEGTVCMSMEGLDQLRILNLSQNFLRGDLPAKLFHLQNLEMLDLSRNDFSGSIPAGGDLLSIKHIDLSANRFEGSVPAGFCEASPHLQVLKLSDNHFTEVSESLGRCTALQQLFLDDNTLSGSFPESLLQLHDLRILQLQGNQFSGPLNEGIGNLSSLMKLDVSANKFSGILPDVFENLGELDYFSAGSNRFNGSFPNSLMNSPSLLSLNLRNTTITGPINLNCSAMIHLTSLNLAANNFQGPIPDSISSCHRLRILNLARNNFTGKIPVAFKNLQALETLSLSNTRIMNVSAAFTILQHCENLTSLFLSGSFQYEQMPSDANLHFRNLKVFSFTRSKVRGSIPLWLSNSNKLQLLDLSFNQLSGTIPSWFAFKSLFYIDLSKNGFTGEIPENLTKLQTLISRKTSLEEIYSGFPIYRSRFRYNGIFNLRPTLNLSYNKLTGPISPRFGNLKGLHVLDLKENRLSGTIPEDLAGMTVIEHLDLSHNVLSGEIPPSLENLNFLSRFNVSYNQLHGDIPKGGQFMTFPPSSFAGNNGLCGGDLIPCQPPQQTTDDQPADEEMSILGLQFVLGAITGFILTVIFCFKVVLPKI